MKFFTPMLIALTALCGAAGSARAVGPDASVGLTPHKALYDINLVATRSGSQIVNISGRMFYEWKPSCEAWITDHRFNLFYEYADSPGMKISSDFTTFEPFDGKSFDFSSRRRRDGTLYQELRGRAEMLPQGGKADFSMPESLHYDLDKGAYFPMAHTIEMVRQARAGKKFFSANVFDGSDEEGPIEINTFIGSKAAAPAAIKTGKNLDAALLAAPAWNVRMAVFPLEKPEEHADYEMSMVFHDNGIISDMLIEYDDFSVTQKLVALERLEGDACDGRASTRGKAPQKPDKSTGKH